MHQMDSPMDHCLSQTYSIILTFLLSLYSTSSMTLSSSTSSAASSSLLLGLSLCQVLLLLVGFVAAAAALDFGFLALDLGFAVALDLGLVGSTLDFFFGGAMVQ